MEHLTDTTSRSNHLAVHFGVVFLGRGFFDYLLSAASPSTCVCEKVVKKAPSQKDYPGGLAIGGECCLPFGVLGELRRYRWSISPGSTIISSVCKYSS